MGTKNTFILQKAAKQALEAIENGAPFEHLDNVIAPALRDALDHTGDLSEKKINLMWEEACKHDEDAIYMFVSMIEDWYGIK